ncbi:MAG: hypothetical protein GX488_07140, partial [Clostridiales bacterium]|nr:hypothetical protein [Clostridiales bacterium]
MKKSIVLILSFTLIVCLFAGCSNDKTTKNSVEPSASAASDSPASESRIIKDSLGREVEIPSTINTIVPLGNTPRMITYLGLANKVVGIGECEHAKSPIQAYAFVNKDLWANLPNVGTDAMGAT